MRARKYTDGSKRNFVDGNKIETYVGFALRAGKVTLGVNAIQTVKKGVYCLLLDRGTAKNSRKEIEKTRTRFDCPLVEVDDLGALVRKEGCKAAAIKDISLAGAIVREAGAQGLTIEGVIG